MRALAGLTAAAVLLTACTCLGQSIGAIERDLIGIVDAVGESIVSVATLQGPVKQSQGLSVSGKQSARSIGCGIVLDTEGHILTTASVIGYAREVEIGTPDGLKCQGTVIGIDPTADIAVVKLAGCQLKPASFGVDSGLRTGSLVFVVGNAFGSLPSVAMGLVSGVDVPAARGERPTLRLSVPINPGDIGGPVVNVDGEVVGIVIGRLTFQSRYQSIRLGRGTLSGLSGGLQPSNTSVAMPIGQALSVANEIITTGGTERGFLGVRVVEISDEIRGEADIAGVIITDVVRGSPAESIGLEIGDVITGFGATEVSSVGMLREAVEASKPGELIKIAYLRDLRARTDGVLLGRMVPEYVRRTAAGEARLHQEQVKDRIEEMETELKRLKSELEDLGKRP